MEDELSDWKEYFDERQKKEINFSSDYAANYNHGTDGHNAKLIVAAMTHLLDRAWPAYIESLKPQKG